MYTVFYFGDETNAYRPTFRERFATLDAALTAESRANDRGERAAMYPTDHPMTSHYYERMVSRER